MLYALEALITTALKTALPSHVEVREGPAAQVPPEAQECVDVVAWGVEFSAPQAEGGQPVTGREPAFFTRTHRWSADGTARDFSLPAEVEGEVLEVESPPGYPIPREDYQVEGRTLHFYQPPAAGAEAVVATLKTGPATGYHERRPCQGRLTVVAWAADFPRTDALLDQALATVLRACVDTGSQESQHMGEGVRLRLLTPTVMLEAMERMQVQAPGRWAPKAEARLRLHGFLDLTVAVGPEKPSSRIQELRYKGTVLPPHR
jgi:hypothetical protein